VTVPESRISALHVHTPVVATVHVETRPAGKEAALMSPTTFVSDEYRYKVLPGPVAVTKVPEASFA